VSKDVKLIEEYWSVSTKSVKYYHACVHVHLPCWLLTILKGYSTQQEPMRFILVLLIMFELQQEPMRFIQDFVLVRQPGLVELLFYVHW